MNQKNKSLRALARTIHRSPSHICRVLKGERIAGAALLAALKKHGVFAAKVAKGGK